MKRLFLTVFERSCLLPVSSEEAFQFHSDTRNIAKVLPPEQELVFLEAHPEAQEGQEFSMTVALWGWPIKWRGQWKKVQPSTLLVDEAVSSPFHTFVHEHRFEAIDEKSCKMIDRVTYAYPLPFLSWLFAKTVGRLQMSAMFKTRHERTKQCLGTEASAENRPA